MKIFIVDDSALMNARIVQAALGVQGVVVAGTASNVMGAVHGIQETEPDALVVDIQLADGNGLRLLASTKSARPAIRSIVLTNSSSDAYRNAASAAGADYFLDKSTEFQQLPQILSAWSQTDMGASTRARM
jgi:DNA-binding NarL/FixJ family response regulator